MCGRASVSVQESWVLRKLCQDLIMVEECIKYFEDAQRTKPRGVNGQRYHYDDSSPAWRMREDYLSSGTAIGVLGEAPMAVMPCCLIRPCIVSCSCAPTV